jgi:hypothetical protein
MSDTAPQASSSTVRPCRDGSVIMADGDGWSLRFSRNQLRILVAASEERLTTAEAYRLLFGDCDGVRPDRHRASLSRTVARLSALGCVNRSGRDVETTDTGRKVVEVVREHVPVESFLARQSG